MQLQVKHSNKYLSTNSDGRAIQKGLGNEWIFIFDNNEIDPKSGKYGRIALKSSSNPVRCLQPSSIYPHDGWLIDLSPIQPDNDSQFWRFIIQDEDDFYIIENKNERREEGRSIRITQACMDVCEAKMGDDIVVITYHISSANGSSNQRWRII
jgi:hypothetical protein